MSEYLYQKQYSIDQGCKRNTAHMVSGQSPKRIMTLLLLMEVPDADSRTKDKVIAAVDEEYQPQTGSQVEGQQHNLLCVGLEYSEGCIIA
jgi:azurin